MVMTIDDYAVDKRKYRTVLSDKVEEIFLDVYLDMSTKAPLHYSTLASMVMSVLFDDLKLQLIEEAVGRRDHELFGLSKNEFLERAYRGEVNDVALVPHIDYEEFHAAMENMLRKMFFVLTLHGAINSPLKEVW